ncbi:MAG: CHRD domain-containing protein [Armatimonadetes bacterium]|nr:CHRD domain-containing protein [Armatimonadota bacterium]
MIRHIIVAGAIFALASVSSAGIWIFDDPLNEALVVPPTGVAATGNASGTFDDVTNLLNITVLASGFVSPRTSAHVHGPATPQQNNSVQLILGVAGDGGDYNNPFRLHTLSSIQANDFLAGLYYVDIHTEDNPAGAIRAQLNPVPEPASMIALGIGTLVLLRRRKKL